ncbi:hypothetical protein Tco_0961938, partial [Tanacetum coccineum]
MKGSLVMVIEQVWDILEEIISLVWEFASEDQYLVVKVESKDLTSLSLDELIGNLKVYEMIIKKDSKIVKAKVERKSLALKAKKESSDEECSTFGSEDEEYAMAVRDFKKFFNRRGRFREEGGKKRQKIKTWSLVAHASSEVSSESSYFSDENSSIDDLALDNEHD